MIADLLPPPFMSGLVILVILAILFFVYVRFRKRAARVNNEPIEEIAQTHPEHTMQEEEKQESPPDEEETR